MARVDDAREDGKRQTKDTAQTASLLSIKPDYCPGDKVTNHDMRPRV